MLIFVQNLTSMKKVFFFLGIIILSTVACQSQNNSKETGAATSEVLSLADFKAKIADGKVQLVDVRTPQEFAQGTIGDAVNIDYLGEAFSGKIQALDKSQPVYIFCRSGNRSGKAAKVMQELGFKEIYDLQGGYLAWSKE